MRPATLVFMIVTLISAVAPADAQRPRFNPDGSFWIIGEVPKPFDDLGGINLNSNHNRRLPSSGVNLTNGALLRFKTISIAREKLIFTTYPRRGVSYRFTGRFLKGGVFFSEVMDEDPVLEGTLTKVTNGRVAAEAKLKFSYFGGT